MKVTIYSGSYAIGYHTNCPNCGDIKTMSLISRIGNHCPKCGQDLGKYHRSGETPFPVFYGRGEDGNKYIVVSEGFVPEMWIEGRDLYATLGNRKIKRAIKDAFNDDKYPTMFGEKTSRIVSYVPTQIGWIRRELENDGILTYQANILFEKKCKVEAGIKRSLEFEEHKVLMEIGAVKVVLVNKHDIKPSDEIIKHRVLTWDLETTHDEARKILSVSAYDTQAKKHLIITTKDINEEKVRMYIKEYIELNATANKLDTIKEIANAPMKIMKALDERELLKMFYDFLSAQSPDIMETWNGEGFDIPVLNERSNILKVDFPLQYYAIESRRFFDFIGMESFDAMKAWKVKMRKSVPAGLDYVSKKILGAGKVDLGVMPQDMFETDPDKLIAYNIIDVVLTRAVSKERHLLTDYMAIAYRSGAFLRETFTNSRVIDTMLLFHAINKNVVVPTKIPGEPTIFNREDDEHGRIGAEVMDAPKGTYIDVGVVDFSRMYPSIIWTANIGVETRDDANGDIITPVLKYSSKKTSLISEMLMDMSKERDKVEAKLKKVEYGTPEWEMLESDKEAIKALMNSFYGVCGFSGFRLHNENVFRTIPAVGRECIKFTVQVIDELKWDKEDGVNYDKGIQLHTLYGHTDSAMFQLPEETHGDIETQASIVKQVSDKVNERLPKHLEEIMHIKKNYMHLAPELIYGSFAMFGKKNRYAGIVDYSFKQGDVRDKPVEDRIKIKGFEAIRGNSAKETKDAQKESFLRLLTDAEPNSVLEYLHERYSAIIGGKVPPKRLAVPVKISKAFSDYDKSIPIHITAAEYSNKYLGKTFGIGDHVLYLYVERVPFGYPQTHVIGLELDDDIPEGFLPDYKKIADNVIISPLSDVYMDLGFSPKDITTGIKAMSLNEFFGD